MRRLLKRLVRTSAFIGKEISEVRRQPRLVLSLILGPFLILLLFGVGYRGETAHLAAIVVIPDDAEYSRDRAEYAKVAGNQLDIADVTTDLNSALTRLKGHDVDIVVVVPKDAAKQIAAGSQAKMLVYLNEVDPLRRDYISYLSYLTTTEINKHTLAAAAGEGQESAGDLRTVIQKMRDSLAKVEARFETGDNVGASSELKNAQGSSASVQLGVLLLSQVLSTDTTLIKPADAQGSEKINLTQGQEVTGRLNGDLEELSVELQSQNPDRQRIKDRLSRVRKDLDDLDQLTGQFQRINPLVLAAPFYATPENTAPIKVSFTSFYAPGVLVLLLQHIAITLAALSMVRERLLGTVELFQVSPVSPGEILTGKYLSFMIFLGVVAAALIALMSNDFVVGGVRLSLGVPILGDWALLVLSIALVIFASLGLGFFIASISKSESQAVQLSMLILLMSVFFSGFFLRITTFWPPIQLVSYALPVTYGISSLQVTMLRGGLPSPLLLITLLFLGTFFGLLGFIRFSREFRRG